MWSLGKLDESTRTGSIEPKLANVGRRRGLDHHACSMDEERPADDCAGLDTHDHGMRAVPGCTPGRVLGVGGEQRALPWLFADDVCHRLPLAARNG